MERTTENQSGTPWHLQSRHRKHAEARKRPASENSKYYLFEVRLRPEINLKNTLYRDRSKIIGDLFLDNSASEALPVVPYLNEHEDRGNISICTTANAIRSTRRFELPMVFGDTGGLSQAVLEQLSLSEDLVYRYGRALQRVKLDSESPY